MVGAERKKKQLRQKGRSFKPILLIFVVLLICIPTVWLAVVRMEGTAPEAEIALESVYVGASRTVTLSVSDAGSGVKRMVNRLQRLSS